MLETVVYCTRIIFFNFKQPKCLTQNHIKLQTVKRLNYPMSITQSLSHYVPFIHTLLHKKPRALGKSELGAIFIFATYKSS